MNALSFASGPDDKVPTSKIDCLISTEEFQELMNKTKESAVSSPSGLHMGNYILCARYYNLAEILTKVISIPFVMGVSFP